MSVREHVHPFVTHWLVPILILGSGLVGVLSASEPTWNFDVVHLKNGSIMRGLIVREQADRIDFRMVQRQPGRPTVLFATHFRRSELSRIERLDADQRERLRQRIDALEAARERIRDRPEQIELQPITWKGKSESALAYDSDYFRLISTAPEPIVRQAAVRIEQIYAAYARYLPAKHRADSPTRILLLGTEAEYREVLKEAGHDFRNPAFYEPSRNRIVCGSNLNDLGQDIIDYRKKHIELWTDLDRREAELRRLYGNGSRDLARHLEPIQEMRRRVRQADQHNAKIVREATSRLFALLYHEAFHAYAGNYVYRDTPLPLWLDEGIAQVFETALVEGNELRVGHADRGRLTRAREKVRAGDLMPLQRLLASGAECFQVGHHGAASESNQAYLTAWALAFFLMFDRELLGGPAFDVYVREVREGDPIATYVKITSKSLKEFEKDFHSYVDRLQSDGSVRKE